MKKIDGTPKSIRELFTGVKYTIHYYQREYQWQTKQIEELLEDLTEAFDEFYQEDHEPNEVLKYGHYFMGSIVLTLDDNAIIDGQQRLTSLTLVLIYLYHHLQDEEDRAEVLQLIYSKKAGTRTFNIHVPEMPERDKVMNALLKPEEEPFDLNDQPETVRNIWYRYQDVVAGLQDKVPDEVLPMFKDWLIDNVDFIRITAQTEQDAHKIFVSMNDRGLSLTPAEMLKGYLLSRIENDKDRATANEFWKKRMLELKELGKEEESDFFKNWFRAQFADTIRERKKNAAPGDFDIIGGPFHKWFREHINEIGLAKTKQFKDFLEMDFKKFSSLYQDLKKYSESPSEGFEHVFYNANRNFTLQVQLILAAIDPSESKEESDRKVKLVSCFLDLYFTRRIFNYKTVDYNAMAYNIFLLTKRIRRKPFDELKRIFVEEINSMEYQLHGIEAFRLNGWTVRYMLHIIARVTYYAEIQSDKKSDFHQYVRRDTRNPYDIEHILADDYTSYQHMFSSEEEFERYRNLLGALLILPSDINRSLQNKPFDQKLDKYKEENLLAQSLQDGYYQNNPRFVRFNERLDMVFKPYSDFNKTAIQERQQLYQKLAEKIWSVDAFDEI
jgi:uncharacterized protein with ParB-like and HNH nuclease domain